jgi:dynein intermediate chain 2
MVAIGDAEGTVSIMQLCKALYETAPREKEEMGKIFDREFRREKTLDIAKRQALEALIKGKKVAKGEKPVDPEAIAVEKESEMKTRLMDIDEKFFEKISKDEGEQEMIKARGQL